MILTAAALESKPYAQTSGAQNACQRGLIESEKIQGMDERRRSKHTAPP